MTIEMARQSIDWLKTINCKIIGIMGGEPLIRKDFILDVIRYGKKNGFLVYLPTNGHFMDEKFIDDVGKAGITAINLAVDCIVPKKGLPKGLKKIESQFKYLVKQQEKYKYIVFLNTNICRTNIEDIKMLTEIAHKYRIAIDYHLNEPPHDFVNINHYKHQDNNLYVTPDKYEEVDELLDWIIEKQLLGWPMVNPINHLLDLKKRMRGQLQPWVCRAGINGLLIRPDGSLSPCFDLITHDYDWGRIWEPKFNNEKLKLIKNQCMPNCSSSCFHTIAYYYKLQNLLKWVYKQTTTG